MVEWYHAVNRARERVRRRGEREARPSGLYASNGSNEYTFELKIDDLIIVLGEFLGRGFPSKQKLNEVKLTEGKEDE